MQAREGGPQVPRIAWFGDDRYALKLAGCGAHDACGPADHGLRLQTSMHYVSRQGTLGSLDTPK